MRVCDQKPLNSPPGSKICSAWGPLPISVDHISYRHQQRLSSWACAWGARQVEGKSEGHKPRRRADWCKGGCSAEGWGPPGSDGRVEHLLAHCLLLPAACWSLSPSEDYTPKAPASLSPPSPPSLRSLTADLSPAPAYPKLKAPTWLLHLPKSLWRLPLP